MAHESTLTGGVSEHLATAMLLSNGFSVFHAAVPEVYDLIVVGKDDDGDNVVFTVQVKTVKIRSDREGQVVIKGANSNGVPYSRKDVDYIFGVHLDSNTGYLIPNNEQSEYWAMDFETARTKWTEYSL
ncbi:group I intron-associated PD-(D/E)XK endonuclease [Macrococcus capreoli]|uniref:group I intron-associated PD-(D/E)XK endonuclease n=1 Tax=Macrococcus capreoli TaxID=2982690 RepID=UPI0021D5F7A6|nr:hypothetical protein [Macrococcus sp. TMW 2.2395]MCU7556585.1 hypothetical protein [Macrococcus sp. TMW 2.2395]